MHPSSPHAPARLNARATGAKGRPGYTQDPLEALSAELHGKVAPGTPSALAHAAAEELQLRRPRRPASGRASFRRAPISR